MNYQLALLFICSCAFTVQSQGFSESFLKSLTDDQVQYLFHTKRETVPRFSAVSIVSPVGTRFRRHIRTVKFEVDGQVFNFALAPSMRSVVHSSIPIWTVESVPHSNPNYTYHRNYSGQKTLQRAFYEDIEKIAVFLPYTEKGTIFYDGLFMNSTSVLAIRAIPESWNYKSQDNARYNHVVFAANIDKNANNYQDIISKDANEEEEKLAEPLTTLYPKILVAVDYHAFKNFGQDIGETAKYLGLYWHAVDLMYKQIQEPVIDIKLKGIIIAKDEYAMNYVYQARDSTKSPNFVNTNGIFQYSNKYFNESFRKDTGFTDYNSAFVLTGLETFGLKGIAYIGHACTKGKNVAVVQADAGYRGFLYATHELGHALGLRHDSLDEQHKCYGYDDTNGSTNTIMAPFLLEEKEHMYWSTCSLRDIKKFAMMKKAECLRYPHV